MKESWSYFQNKQCRYFPCHSGSAEHFNCLFCYCPLYALGDRCGGSFRYTEDGIKDCSACLLPHGEQGYTHVMSKIGEVMELARKKDSRE